MAPRGAGQLFTHSDGDLLVDGNGAESAAFLLDGDNVFSERLIPS